MKTHLLLGTIALTLLSGSAFAQVGATTSAIVTMSATGDYCANPSVAKLSTAVSITTATTTNLVSATTGKSVYICGFLATVSGTNPTFQFEYGTTASTACDTGATVLTGAFTPTTAVTTAYQWDRPLTYMTGLVSNQVCLVTTGTPVVKGFLIYVVK